MIINGRKIGRGEPVYIIAEMSANHCGEFERAEWLIRQAKIVGADAIKVQTFTPDTMTIDHNGEGFVIGEDSLWAGRTLYDLYREAAMPWEWYPKLQKIADEVGITLFSTAYDETSVDFLEEMNVPAYKVASFEITDTPLLEKIARTGKPVILSSGMATLEEIYNATGTLWNYDPDHEADYKVAILKCTSAYPAPESDANLRTIPLMLQRFVEEVGISDHTFGITVPIAAVSLGACIVEKHITAAHEQGLDGKFSLEPNEFREMVTAIRRTEESLGEMKYGPTESEKSSLAFRRSLYVVKDIKDSEVFTKENVRSIRPGHGMSPALLDVVLGVQAIGDIKRGTPLQTRMVCR